MRRGIVVASLVTAAVAAGGIALLLRGGGGGTVGVPERDEGSDAAGSAPAALRAAAREAHPPAESIAVRVKGRVVDKNGRPAPHMPVGARWTRSAAEGGSSSEAARFRANVARLETPSTLVPKYELRGETDDHGSYELTVRRPGLYDFEAFPAPPSWCLGTWVTVAETGAEAADLQVLDGSPLKGRLVDAAGHGVVGVVDGSWDLGAWGWDMDPLLTAPSGEFTIPAVPEGTGDLTVYVAGRGRLEEIRVRTPRADPLTIVVAGFGGVVRGRVRDTAGSPVAGADVMVTVRGPVLDEANAYRHADRPPVGAFRARTEPDGGWRIDDAAPGRVTQVEAAAEGYTFHSSTPPLATWSGATIAAGVETTIDVTLVKGGTIAGRVVETGTLRPIPKATVVLQRVDAGRTWPRPQPMRALSGDDGTYRVEGAALGRWIARGSAAGAYDVAMASAREKPESERETLDPPQESLAVLSREGETVEHTVVLAPGFTARGRVVGPDGKPVEGAAITGDEIDARLVYRWGGQWARNDAVATSGTDGTFTVTGLAPRADATFSAKKSPLVDATSAPFAVGPDLPVPDVLLSLTRGGSVGGVVLDPEGKPVPDIRVRSSGASGETSYTHSGADGTFLLEGVPAGAVSISAWGNGWSEGGTPSLSLAAGERKEHVEIRMRKQVQLRGVLVDEAGLGVGGVAIKVQIGGDSTETSSDDDGTFSVDLDAGSRVDLEVGSGETKIVVPGITAPADAIRLVVKRPPSTAFEGRVVDAAGEVVPLCRVTVMETRAPAEGLQPTDEVADAVGGAFRVVTTRKPPVVLRASAAQDAAGRTLNLLDGDATVDDPARGPVTIVMKPGLAIHGRVVDEEGLAVPKAAVRVARSPGGDPVDRTTTDSDGAFVFVALAPGPCELVVAPPAPFVAPQPLSVEAGAAGATIRLTAGASIAGRLVGPDGAPHRGEVTARWGEDAGAGSATKKVLEDGRFRFDGVPRGASVELVALFPDGNSGEDPLLPARTQRVHAGAVDVTLVLRRGVVIAGVVATQGGRIPTSLVVRAVRRGATSEDSDEAEASVEQGGAFRIVPLEPGGSWTVTVSTPGAGELAKRENVTAPAQGVRFVVPDPNHVTGRVVGTGDLSSFTVRMWVDGRDPQSADAVGLDAEGKFECDLLPDHAYRFTASSWADSRFAAVGPLAKGTSAVTLTLVPGVSIAGVVQRGTKSQGPARRAISVTAKSAEWYATAQTGTDGRFILYGLPPGVYTVRAEQDGGDAASVEGVRAGATDVVVRLP